MHASYLGSITKGQKPCETRLKTCLEDMTSDIYILCPFKKKKKKTKFVALCKTLLLLQYRVCSACTSNGQVSKQITCSKSQRHKIY